MVHTDYPHCLSFWLKYSWADLSDDEHLPASVVPESELSMAVCLTNARTRVSHVCVTKECTNTRHQVRLARTLLV